MAEKHLAIAGDGDEDGIFLIRFLHGDRILVFAMSTVMPFDSIGVMTMKMMSITSITSTIGVTLMSATGGGAFALSNLLFFCVPSSVSRNSAGEAGARQGSPNSTRLSSNYG